MSKNQTQEVNVASANFGAKGWVIIAISLLCIMFQSSLINDSLNLTIPAFAETFGWNISALYLYSTIAAWCAVAGGIIWGTISHRINVRVSWAISLAVTAVACFLWGNTDRSIVYLVCISIAAIGGMGFCYIANLNVIANWFPKKKGMAMGIVTCGFPISASLSMPLVGNLMANGGMKQVYTFYAIVAVVLCVIVVLFVRDYPEQAGAYPDNNKHYDLEQAKKELEEGMTYMKNSHWNPKKLFGTTKVWMIAFSLGVMELLALGIMTNFVPRGLQAGYQQSEIVAMLGFTGICAIVGSLGCGFLDAKLGPKKAIIVTFTIAIICLVLNLIPTRITMYASLLFLGVMLGGSANYLVSLTNTIWGRYDFPMAYKVLKTLVAAIGALGVALVGILGNVFSYAIAYGVLAVLAGLALVMTVFIDDTLIGKN